MNNYDYYVSFMVLTYSATLIWIILVTLLIIQSLFPDISCKLKGARTKVHPA